MLTNILIAVGTLVLGVLTTYHYSNRRSLAYVARGRKVLDPVGGQHPPEVEIIFDGVKVSSLDEWKVLVWNSGNQTINDSDVAEALGFKFGDDIVLKTVGPLANRPAIRPMLKISGSSVELSFDFMDRADYVLFSAYVVPPLEDHGKLETRGAIRGIPRGATDMSRFDALSARDTSIFSVGVIMSGIAVPFALYAFIQTGQALELWAIFEHISVNLPRDKLLRWILFVAWPLGGIFFLWVGWIASNILWRYFVAVPKAVRKHLVSDAVSNKNNQRK